jgi:nitroimidazol reductase NimA-like FMN-containing flavoprotein (pyridoxamine 5'-phosphate oxidase superfamily)
MAEVGERRTMQELTAEQSLALLSSVSMGRVVFTHQALPAVRPVNHLVDNGQIIIRTHPGAAVLAAAGSGSVVAYQADEIDPAERLGWSVVVTGVARLLDERAAAGYHDLLRPWVDRPMGELIAISSDIVTGFALRRAGDSP